MKVVRVNNSAASRDSQSRFVGWRINASITGFGASLEHTQCVEAGGDVD